MLFNDKEALYDYIDLLKKERYELRDEIKKLTEIMRQRRCEYELIIDCLKKKIWEMEK